MPTIRTAELLSVGTELLLGEIVDTNSAYLATSLAEHGVDVYWSQRVGDNLGRIAEAIRQAMSRSDLLVIGGGLGPTDDDMTREGIAQALGEEVSVNAELERTLRERFAAFTRRMPDMNLKQAWLIPPARALENPIGTAPGWFVEKNGKTIIALPGPPRELKKMWQEQALPRLTFPPSFLLTRTFKTLGLGESGVAERLGGLTKQANPSVATYAKKDGVHVRVAAKGSSATEARTLAWPTLERVENLLKDLTWGHDKDELPELVLTKLQSKGLRLATLETLSAGMLSQLLSNAQLTVIKDANIYEGGMVAYPMQASAALSFLMTTIERFGVASLETALAMARAAAELFHTELGLAVTGTPLGASPEARATNVQLAVHGPPDLHGPLYRSLTLPRLEAEWLQERASYGALSLLWTSLGGLVSKT